MKVSAMALTFPLLSTSRSPSKPKTPNGGSAATGPLPVLAASVSPLHTTASTTVTILSSLLKPPQKQGKPSDGYFFRFCNYKDMVKVTVYRKYISIP